MTPIPQDRSQVIARVEHAIKHLQTGGFIVLIDKETRENEGDLVALADMITPASVNFMAKEARGLICLTLHHSIVERLRLPMMADPQKNSTPLGTAFTVSIEAREGVTTGISAHDRAHTIRAAIAENARPEDLVVPGHIFPLKAREGGVLERNGHTEGSVDLARLAGKKPAAVICEIMNEDGTMARLPDLQVFAARFNLPIVTIEDLIVYRSVNDPLPSPSMLPRGEKSRLNQRFLLIVSSYHQRITSGLAEGARKTLLDNGVAPADILCVAAPGAFELPVIAARAARKGDWAAIIGLGCVIRGETNHSEYINQAIASGFTQISIETGVPVLFGVVTTDNVEQAYARSGIHVPEATFHSGKPAVHNKGSEAALAALNCLATLRQLSI